MPTANGQLVVGTWICVPYRSLPQFEDRVDARHGGPASRCFPRSSSQAKVALLRQRRLDVVRLEQ